MQLPPHVPVMTLPDVTLFPQAMQPLHIFEPRYRRMLADALAGPRMFAVALRKPGSSRETPSAVAGLGLIRAAVTNQDGTTNLVLQGIVRVELTGRIPFRPYRVHTFRVLPAAGDAGLAVRHLARRVLELVNVRLEQGQERPFRLPPGPAVAAGSEGLEDVAVRAFREVLRRLTKLEEPEQMADLISATFLADPKQRQIILETLTLEGRLRHLVRFLTDTDSAQPKS